MHGSDRFFFIQTDSLMNAVYTAGMCVDHALQPPFKFINQQEEV